jgi:hypothetical protein
MKKKAQKKEIKKIKKADLKKVKGGVANMTLCCRGVQVIKTVK